MLTCALALGAVACGRSDAPSATASGPAAAGGSRFMPDGPARDAVVWAVGDTSAQTAAGRAVARLIARDHPDVVLYLGDVYPDGTARDFRVDYAPEFGPLARRTAPTPGNHDWPNRGQGYLPYWARVRGRGVPPFYSFRAGGWQLLSLDSEIGGRADQMRWLRDAIRTPGTCRLAFWHRPRFSGGMHGDFGPMDGAWRALRGHATLVASGHDHDMQRFRPRGGLIQLVSGAGGRSHYAVDRSHPGLAFADDRSWGALRIELRPGQAQLDFISVAGRRLDSTSAACSG